LFRSCYKQVLTSLSVLFRSDVYCCDCAIRRHDGVLWMSSLLEQFWTCVFVCVYVTNSYFESIIVRLKRGNVFEQIQNKPKNK
jgi:hypothetical protein